MGKPWQSRDLFHAIAVVLVVITATEWGVTAWRESILERENLILRNSINDPSSGFIARAVMCEANTSSINKAFTGLRDTLAEISKARRESVEKNAKTLSEALKAINDNSAQIKINNAQITALAKASSGISANQ